MKLIDRLYCALKFVNDRVELGRDAGVESVSISVDGVMHREIQQAMDKYVKYMRDIQVSRLQEK